jgi:hypothetical protein
MPKFQAGITVIFTRKITECDINHFAELTGDFSPNHVDEEYMKNSIYGKRIAHGALLVGFMSNASSMIIENHFTDDNFGTPVSLGYDHIRSLNLYLLMMPLLCDIPLIRLTINRKGHRRRSKSPIKTTNWSLWPRTY